jgi:thiamine biosynthesis lipoprotein
MSGLMRRALLLGGFGLAAFAAAPGPGRAERRLRLGGVAMRFVVAEPEARRAAAALDAAEAAVRRVHRAASLFDPDSALRRLNAAGVLAQPDPLLVALLRGALGIAAATRGAFDPSVQPLWEAYATAQRAGGLPDAAGLAAARELVDWRAVEVSEDLVRLGRPGMRLTLNGIAQGFAADQALAAIRAAGIRTALVDTGEVGALGAQSGRAGWTVALPGIAAEGLLLEDAFLAISADDVTTFSADRRHHHILDPVTGLSPTALSRVAVRAPTGLLADGWSTALMVTGHDGERALPPGCAARMLPKMGGDA